MYFKKLNHQKINVLESSKEKNDQRRARISNRGAFVKFYSWNEIRFFSRKKVRRNEELGLGFSVSFDWIFKMISNNTYVFIEQSAHQGKD